jgi:hypothetical protein
MTVNITFESAVTWTRTAGHWGYPVPGVVKNFIDVHYDGGPVLAANVLVSADVGLYRRGDVITVCLGELEAKGGEPHGEELEREGEGAVPR